MQAGIHPGAGIDNGKGVTLEDSSGDCVMEIVGIGACGNGKDRDGRNGRHAYHTQGERATEREERECVVVVVAVGAGGGVGRYRSWWRWIVIMIRGLWYESRCAEQEDKKAEMDGKR